MAHDIGFVHEKLYAAVLSLASGRGTLAERLGQAFAGQLAVLAPEDFPEVTPDGLVADDRQDFRDLAARLAALQAEGGGVLGDEEAERLIGIVVSLYNTITELHGYAWYQAEQRS